MNFLRLSDLWLSVLFEDDDIIAIDKPYGFNAHTNDSKLDHSDFIQDGLIEIYEKQFQRKLYIIHRLDQTTTGVMIFGKSPESAKKYAEYFFNRQVHKTYWFITKSQSIQNSFTIDKIIIHKAKELESLTDLRVIKKNKRHELWEAKPHTGRNHQIRIHSQAAGIPILGDEIYGGASFPFICLHNCKIEFPNGITIESQPPEYFKNLDLLEDIILTKMLFETDRRQRLFSFLRLKDACFRLALIQYNKEDIFTIDLIGHKIIVQWFKSNLNEHDKNRFQYYCNWLQTPLLIQLAKEANTQNNRFIFLSPMQSQTNQSYNNWVAIENKTQYEIHCENNLLIDISTDQRLQRNWLKQNSKDKTVLNLFSQNSSYGLCAALGQSKQVTMVDLNKKLLNFSRNNFQLNNLSIESHRFLCRDSSDFIEICRNKNNKFDIIVCDIPSFYRQEKGFFKIENDLEKLIINCLSCVTENGFLLFSLHSERLYVDDIRKMLVNIQSSQKMNIEINNILPGLDYELANEKPVLKSFLLQKKY